MYDFILQALRPFVNRFFAFLPHGNFSLRRVNFSLMIRRAAQKLLRNKARYQAMERNGNMKQPKQKRKPAALSPETLAEIWQPVGEEIPTDVLGSYTGTGIKSEQPEQDADDL